MRRALTGMCLGIVTVAICLAPAGSAGTTTVPAAKVSGPVTGGMHGFPYIASLVPLHRWGYVEREYDVSGTATGGGTTAIPQPRAASSMPAAYRTRILVRRPASAARFNGTVLVEWFNATSQQDYDADWSEGYREILRGGYAYVGVSAQQAGVNTMKAWDPERYGDLDHPGDGYSASIYAQVLRTLRAPNGVNPLRGLDIKRIIADGHSQSGISLHTFVDTVQEHTPLADGFLIRGDGTTNYDVAHLRTPVLQYQSEEEVDGQIATLQRLRSTAPTAKDSAYYRLWQVAGATHTSSEGAAYLFGSIRHEWAGAPGDWNEQTAGKYDGTSHPTCASSIGVGPLDEFPQWYTVDAAIHALNRWVVTGRAPAPAPRVAIDSSGAIARDRYGNAKGGVRDPVVDVPVATYRGDDGCPLSGVTMPLSAASLHSLYPTHAAYVRAMTRAIGRCVRAGWLRPYDAADLLVRANAERLG